MIIVNGTVVVGPYVVDANSCEHSTEGDHNCVHDWRIEWGNVPRTET